MKKRIAVRMLFLIIFIGFAFGSFAVADDKNMPVDLTALENFTKRLQQDESYVPRMDLAKIIENYESTGSIGITLKDFTDSFVKFIFKEIVVNSRLLVELLFLSILCAILQNVQNAFSDDNVSKIAYYACYLLMIIIIIKSFMNAIQIGREAIDSMVQFTNALMPPLLVMLAAVGGFASAATLDPIIMFVIKITSDIIRDLILPMSILVVIINIVDNLSDNIKITKLGALIKQVNTWVLGIIMTVFVGIVTVRTSVSTTLDQVTLKTAKYAVDNFIPVVGKCLSDAISTVTSYSLVLKDAVSIVGLIIMLCICLFPLLKIIITSLVYKFVGAVMEPIVDKRIVDCLTSVGNSMTIIFACVLSVSIMFFIMITIIISTGRLVTMVR